MSGQKYIEAFLRLELIELKSQISVLESMPKEQKEYPWGMLMERLAQKRSYITRLLDELPARYEARADDMVELVEDE